MSEPSSLYMRVTLTEKSLNAFKRSQLLAPRQYRDWQPWLSSRNFCGQITDIQTIEPLDQPGSNELSVEDYLSSTLGTIFWSPSESHYDPDTNVWTLSITQFSENYGDFLRELAILRAVERYKDLPGDDFILIYPYLWGGTPDAYLEIDQGRSRLTDEVPEDMLNEASLALSKLIIESYPGCR